MVKRFPGLDEYDSQALIMALKGTLPRRHSSSRRDPAVVREHFRVLREALLAWAEDRLRRPACRRSAFQEGAVAAMDEARRLFAGGNVLVVSSGGPISSNRSGRAAGARKDRHITQSAHSKQFAHGIRLSASRHQLVSFNALPHLDTQSDPSLITYA